MNNDFGIKTKDEAKQTIIQSVYRFKCFIKKGLWNSNKLKNKPDLYKIYLTQTFNKHF